MNGCLPDWACSHKDAVCHRRRSMRWVACGLFVAGFILAAIPAGAAETLADREPTTFWKRIEDKGLYERAWEALTFYENEENDTIQSFALIGRYHGQFWRVDSDQGSDDGWENRRIFFGAEAMLFRQLSLHAQVALSEDFDPLYESLYQAFIEWSPDDQLVVAVGRVDFLFAGLERSLSSNRIVTFERGLLANQILPGELVGVGLGWKGERLSWRMGVFSGSIKDEFTSFEGGVAAVAGIGVKLPLFYDTGRLHLDYLFNDGNAANNALRPYDHVVSLWHQGQAGPVGVGVDVTWAHGLNGRPPVLGFTLLPTWVVTTNLFRNGDDLQLALRYQFASSDGNNGLVLQQRYEQEIVPAGAGDRYHAVYAGINYRLYGDRLKLMTGVEYAVMRDSASDGGSFDGWTYYAGLRTFF